MGFYVMSEVLHTLTSKSPLMCGPWHLAGKGVHGDRQRLMRPRLHILLSTTAKVRHTGRITSRELAQQPRLTCHLVEPRGWSELGL